MSDMDIYLSDDSLFDLSKVEIKEPKKEEIPEEAIKFIQAMFEDLSETLKVPEELLGK